MADQLPEREDHSVAERYCVPFGEHNVLDLTAQRE